MNDIYRIANSDAGLSLEEIRVALLESLEGRTLRKVLILPPDFPVFAREGPRAVQIALQALVEDLVDQGTLA